MTSSWLKEHLLCSTMIAGLAATAAFGLPTTVLAQDADDEPEVEVAVDEEEDEITEDKVVVTGSRLRRSEFDSASPIQIIDGEVARDLGLVDAADLLQQTTVVQGQQTTLGLSTSGGVLTDSGPGSATVSLRGLEAGRTLVMVNGRRLAPAGVRGAPSAPDLNLIPGSLIQRVEILLDGASSIYGSDAVAGVANVILRDDFDGLQLDAFYTDPEMSGNGGQQQVYSATWGVSNDRGFVGFAAEYNQIQGFTERQFGSFYDVYSGGCDSVYIYGASGTTYDYCGGSFGEASGSVTGVGFVAFDPALGPGDPDLPTGWSRVPITADLLTEDSVGGRALLLFPEELDAVRAPDFRRWSMYSTGEYNLNAYGDMTAYFEASYSLRETETATSGQSRVRLPGDYALNPFGADMTLYFGSFLETETDVSQLRAVTGLRGELPDMNWGSFKDWSYDIYASYSRSNGFDRVKGTYFYPRFAATLENTYIDGNGDPQCDDTIIVGETQTVSCRPLNFFDETFMRTGRFADAADNDYFFPNRMTRTVVEQSMVSGFLTGTLFELPAGPVGAVFGFEYRDDEIVTDTDAGASAGDFFGFFADPGSNGSRDLKEAFVELEIPVLRDLWYADDLTINLAGRWTEEEFFGAYMTYRLQGIYSPVEWFKFRGTYGTSFRAPNLGEQFGGRTTGFANPSDPCRVPGVALPFVDHDNDPTTPDQRQYDPSFDTREPELIQKCINGGGPFGLAGVDPFTLGTTGLGTAAVTFLGAPTQVATGSNPNLQAETSDAISLGIVFEQPWFDFFDMRFSATYFDIEVDGQVANLSAAAIVQLCYDSPNLTSEQCRFVTRGGETNEILFVEALNQNLGALKSEGIDLNLEASHEFKLPWFDDVFTADVVVRATRALANTRDEVDASGTNVIDLLGEYGYPRWRANYTGTLGFRDFRFRWNTRFVDNMIEDNDDPFDANTSSFSPCVQAGDTPCNVLEDSPRYWVHDASLTWASDTWIMRAGVSNVFDDAPLSQTNSGNSIRGVGYDLNGRTYFYNVTKKF